MRLLLEFAVVSNLSLLLFIKLFADAENLRLLLLVKLFAGVANQSLLPCRFRLALLLLLQLAAMQLSANLKKIEY